MNGETTLICQFQLKKPTSQGSCRFRVNYLSYFPSNIKDHTHSQRELKSFEFFEKNTKEHPGYKEIRGAHNLTLRC